MLDDPGSDRFGVGAHLDLRVVFSWTIGALSVGLRARVHGWTQEPQVAVDATLEGVLSFAVSMPM